MPGFDERDVIARLLRPMAAQEPDALDLQDDVARLAPVDGAIITLDTLVEGVHFLPGDPINTVARKLVRVNVSDVLSKGAQPDRALLSLAWTPDREGLEPFCRALSEELSDWGVRLIGGDTTCAPVLTLSMTLTGICLGPGPILRRGARAGDDVWVTGDIGAAGAGLRALTARTPAATEVIAAYQSPRLAGRAGAACVAEFATAALDISDGLLIDASRLAAASEVHLAIDLDTVPFSPSLNVSDPEMALQAATAGDDYQILFTAPPSARSAIARFNADLKVSRIGRIEAGEGSSCRWAGAHVDLPDRLGWVHRG